MTSPKPRPSENQYNGRWVVRLNGHIIAQGGTPSQAQQQARLIYPKEELPVEYMPLNTPFSFDTSLTAILEAMPPEQEYYLVGGVVRDAFLRRRSAHDIDILVPQNALQIARALAKRLQAAYYPLDKSRGIARVIWQPGKKQTIIDINDFRAPSLEEDLRARDFTINAMAWDARHQTLLDPLGGAADLRAGRIRQCRPSSLAEDPLRVLRAIRLAAALSFHLETATRQSARAAAQRLDEITPERIRDEMLKILDGPSVASALKALDMLGALEIVFPEITPLKGLKQASRHVYDVWQHTLALTRHLESILEALSPHYDQEKAANLHLGLLVLQLGRYRKALHEHLAQSLNGEQSLRSLLFLAGIYHDTGKADTLTLDADGQPHFRGHPAASAKKISWRARQMNFSRREIQRLSRIVRHHMRFPNLTRQRWETQTPLARRDIYHFFRETQSCGVDVVLLGLADLRATYEHTLPQDLWVAALETARQLLENYWEKPEESIAPPRLLDGNTLMQAFNLSPGPRLGAALQALEEAQASGQVVTHSDALVFIERWLEAHPTGEET